MFIKTDLNVPDKYDKVVFNVGASFAWDCTPTTVAIRIHCEDDKGNNIHQVASTSAAYYDYATSEAILIDIKKLVRIFKRIPKPNKVVFNICNLGAFMLLTKQMGPPDVSIEFWAIRARQYIKDIGVDFEINLGDPSISLEFEKYMYNEGLSYKIPGTLERMGLKHKAYIDKERRIRRRLRIWKN